MITIDFDGPIEDHHTCGIFFKPKSHKAKYYLIRFSAVEAGVTCVADIFETGIPQTDEGKIVIENGSEIAAFEVDHQYRITLYGKYYFPEFVEKQYQWYYNSKDGMPYKQDEDGPYCEVMAMAEVMRFALAKGLEFGNITPY